VIVTTYNRPRALARVLAGLAVQTVRPAQVIVADDGSGPQTAAVVRDFSRVLPGMLQHVWQADRGFRAAYIRNRAVQRAAGAYLIFLDGDCIPDRRFVADHLRLAQSGTFFQGKRVLVEKDYSENFSIRDTTAPLKLAGRVMRGDLKNSHHLLRLPFWPPRYCRRLGGVRSCNMGIFRRDLYAVNGFNRDFTGWGREDSELVVRLYRLGLRRKEHPFMAICYHLWHGDHDRSRLAANDRLLQATLQSGSCRCANGLA